MAQEQYENLPGVKVTYQDGNLYSGNQTLNAGTKSMLIIGSAVDGPVGVPVSATQLGVKVAEKLFGGLVDRKTKQPLPVSLVRGMYEAVKAGNQDVRLLRMDGRSAKTVLAAKDLARETEQFLDYAEGNKSFSADVKVPAGGLFVGLTSVMEKDAAGNQVTLNLNTVVDYVDHTVGSEKVYFFPNKMRPGNSVVFDFDYETRNYTMVPKTNGGVPDYSDPDYTLTRDAALNHYFYSARKNWSDKLESGHIPVVTVRDANGGVFTIPSMNAAGEFIYRVGKGQTANPLTDSWSAQDYKDGGIFFTAAYDAEVAKGTYPNITGAVTVVVEYAWYTSYANKAETTATIPGTAESYDLSYTPMTDGFLVFYVVDGVKTVLTEGVDYSLSLLEKKVTLNAGVAPVGAQLFADYKTQASTSADPQLVVEGKYPGSIYGRLTDLYDSTSIAGVSAQVEIDPEDPTGEHKIITFFKPEEKRLTYKDNALVYRTKALPRITTMRQFINYVNNDAMNNVVSLSCDNAFGQVAVKGLLPTNGVIFLGQVAPGVLKEDPTQPANTSARFPWLGDDGLFDVTNEQDMQRVYELLGGQYDTNASGDPVLVTQGIYQRLENYVVDQIVLRDVYYNTVIDSLDNSDEAKNFGTQLAQHCAIVTAKTWETIGFIGIAPAPNADLLSVQRYIEDLTAPGMNEHYMYNEATHEYILDEEGEKIDIGRYVNVVFGPELGLSNERLGSYVSSGEVVYAALTSTLNPEVATTNKAIDSVYALRYTLSEAQHNQLVGGRYVTFDQKTTNTGSTRFVVKDGVTAALATSDYTRLSTVRITHAAVQEVRQTADPFIGQPNGLAQRNALAAEVQAKLDRMKELGILQRFTFTIYSSVQDRVIGNAFITLELVPQFETRKFLTSVVLKAS